MSRLGRSNTIRKGVIHGPGESVVDVERREKDPYYFTNNDMKLDTSSFEAWEKSKNDWYNIEVQRRKEYAENNGRVGIGGGRGGGTRRRRHSSRKYKKSAKRVFRKKSRATRRR